MVGPVQPTVLVWGGSEPRRVRQIIQDFDQPAKIETDHLILSPVGGGGEILRQGRIHVVESAPPPGGPAHHPYDTAELIAVPIAAGAADYVAWLRTGTEDRH